jgi:NitT/TauT family transport system substrate-binding protein
MIGTCIGFSQALRRVLSIGLGLTTLASAAPPAHAADLDYGKSGDPVHLVVGYQPYFSESWSGAVLAGRELWKKYLPAGSTVEFSIGLQGSIIVNAMLAGKQSIGYLGDMPAIVATTKREVADIRIVAAIGLGHDMCNIVLLRKDAPEFGDAKAAVEWLNGKSLATPNGSCADRFARAVNSKAHVTPASYLNQSLEVITSGFRAGKIDGAVVWEPTASRLVSEGLARRVATGNHFGEPDGAFLDMRADLIRQRPDVVNAWLQAELDAELFIADPKNADEVVRIIKSQTTGFTEEQLKKALVGPYPAKLGGSRERLSLPFALTPAALDLIHKDAAFLYSIKSIATETLPADAIVTDLADSVLKQRRLKAPVAEIIAAKE